MRVSVLFLSFCDCLTFAQSPCTKSNKHADDCNDVVHAFDSIVYALHEAVNICHAVLYASDLVAHSTALYTHCSLLDCAEVERLWRGGDLSVYE